MNIVLDLNVFNTMFTSIYLRFVPILILINHFLHLFRLHITHVIKLFISRVNKLTRIKKVLLKL